VAVAKNPGGFAGFARRLWGTDFNVALDAKSATCQMLGGGRKVSIVIMDPDLKVIFKGGDPHKGQYYRKVPGKPPMNYAILKDGMAKVTDKGLLGGLTVPKAAATAVKALRSGQMASAQRGLSALSNAGDAGKFKKELLERLEALRAGKRSLFDALEKAGEKWEAYKAGSSYLRCFPNAKDSGEVKKKVGSLGGDAVVRKNLEAKRTFDYMVAQIYGPRRNSRLLPQAKTTFKKVADKYKDTEYGKLAELLAK